MRNIKFGEKITKLKLKQQQFEYSFTDCEHPNFTKMETNTE